MMISNLNHTNIANGNVNTSESFDDLPTDFALRIAAGLLSYFCFLVAMLIENAIYAPPMETPKRPLTSLVDFRYQDGAFRAHLVARSCSLSTMKASLSGPSCMPIAATAT